MITRTTTIVRMVDVKKIKKSRAARRKSVLKSIVKSSQGLELKSKIKSHHVRTKSRAQKELNSVIKRSLANESPNKSVSSTKLESYKLPTLNSRGMNRSPTRNESSFKKIKFHSACNTPARQGSMRSRALPMLPNVRDLLNPMGTKNGSHNESQKEISRSDWTNKESAFSTPSTKRITDTDLKLNLKVRNHPKNLSKSIRKIITQKSKKGIKPLNTKLEDSLSIRIDKESPKSSEITTRKFFSRNSKPPTSNNTGEKSQFVKKDQSFPSQVQHFKIKHKPKTNSLINSLLQRSVEYRKKFDNSLQLSKFRKNDL